MNLDIANGTPNIGGEYFKPKEHASAYAIIFEPKEYRPDVPSQWGPKNYIDGDITIFLSAAEVEQGKPSTIMPGATVEGNLARSLSGLVGRVSVGKLGQVPTKKGNPAWTIEALPQETVAGLAKYLEAREAAKQEELPDFLRGA